MIAVLVLAVVWNLVANLIVPSGGYLPFNLLGVALLVLLAHRSGLTAADLGLQRSTVRRGLVLGGAVALVVGLSLGIALAVPALEAVLEDDAVAGDPPRTRWFLPLVRIPLGTVLFEELLFRSVLYGLVLRRRGERAALWVTASLFGLWHVLPAWGGDRGSGDLATVVVTVAVTTGAGVLFALLRRWSGSVVAPILAHTATNSLAYVAAVVALEVVA